MKREFVVKRPRNVEFGTMGIMSALAEDMDDVMKNNKVNSAFYDYQVMSNDREIVLVATYNEKKSLSQF